MQYINFLHEDYMAKIIDWGMPMWWFLKMARLALIFGLEKKSVPDVLKGLIIATSQGGPLSNYYISVP